MSGAPIDESFDQIFGGLPSTWPTDSDDAKRIATEIARKHEQEIAVLNDLASQHGGGLTGLASGMLALLERRQLITANDKQRLDALLQAFSAYPDDPAATLGQVRALEDAARRDPASTGVALSMLSVASAGVADAASVDSEFVAGQTSALADLVGITLGASGGPAGMLLVGLSASEIVSQAMPPASS